jgi:hypothetical protein
MVERYIVSLRWGKFQLKGLVIQAINIIKIVTIITINLDYSIFQV